MEADQAWPVECVAVADVRQPTEEEKTRFGTRFCHDCRHPPDREDLDSVVTASYEVHRDDEALLALRKGIPVCPEMVAPNGSQVGASVPASSEATLSASCRP